MPVTLVSQIALRRVWNKHRGAIFPSKSITIWSKMSVGERNFVIRFLEMSLKRPILQTVFKSCDEKFMKCPKSNKRRVSNKRVGGRKKFKN